MLNSEDLEKPGSTRGIIKRNALQALAKADRHLQGDVKTLFHFSHPNSDTASKQISLQTKNLNLLCIPTRDPGTGGLSWW